MAHVEIVAEFAPDVERMMRALMIVLEIEDLPPLENDDTLTISESVS